METKKEAILDSDFNQSDVEEELRELDIAATTANEVCHAVTLTQDKIFFAKRKYALSRVRHARLNYFRVQMGLRDKEFNTDLIR